MHTSSYKDLNYINEDLWNIIIRMISNILMNIRIIVYLNIIINIHYKINNILISIACMSMLHSDNFEVVCWSKITFFTNTIM